MSLVSFGNEDNITLKDCIKYLAILAVILVFIYLYEKAKKFMMEMVVKKQEILKKENSTGTL